MPTPLQDIAVIQQLGPFLSGHRGTSRWKITNLDYAFRRESYVKVRVLLRRFGVTYQHVAEFPSEELDRLVVWNHDVDKIRAALRRYGEQAADEALDLLTLGRLRRTDSQAPPA